MRLRQGICSSALPEFFVPHFLFFRAKQKMWDKKYQVSKWLALISLSVSDPAPPEEAICRSAGR
jgi:hypothetical protein